MAKGQYEIPFSRGNQVDYAWHGEAGIKWVDNFVFSDTLTLDHTSRGRSSVTFHWVRQDGTTVTMFLRDFEDLVKAKTIKNGVVSGKWTFTKRGANYGCKLAEA